MLPRSDPEAPPIPGTVDKNAVDALLDHVRRLGLVAPRTRAVPTISERKLDNDPHQLEIPPGKAYGCQSRTGPLFLLVGPPKTPVGHTGDSWRVFMHTEEGISEETDIFLKYPRPEPSPHNNISAISTGLLLDIVGAYWHIFGVSPSKEATSLEALAHKYKLYSYNFVKGPEAAQALCQFMDTVGVPRTSRQKFVHLFTQTLLPIGGSVSPGGDFTLQWYRDGWDRTCSGSLSVPGSLSFSTPAIADSAPKMQQFLAEWKRLPLTMSELTRGQPDRVKVQGGGSLPRGVPTSRPSGAKVFVGDTWAGVGITSTTGLRAPAVPWHVSWVTELPKNGEPLPRQTLERFDRVHQACERSEHSILFCEQILSAIGTYEKKSGGKCTPDELFCLFSAIATHFPGKMSYQCTDHDDGSGGVVLSEKPATRRPMVLRSQDSPARMLVRLFVEHGILVDPPPPLSRSR